MKIQHKINIMVKFSLFIAVFSMLLLTSCAQKDTKEEMILGKWVAFKTIKLNGDSLNFQGEPFEPREGTIEFLENGIINVYNRFGDDYPSSIAKYNFYSDSMLLMGNRHWKIDKLTNDLLIMHEEDPDFPTIPSLDLVEYYRKVEEDTP